MVRKKAPVRVLQKAGNGSAQGNAGNGPRRINAKKQWWRCSCIKEWLNMPAKALEFARDVRAILTRMEQASEDRLEARQENVKKIFIRLDTLEKKKALLEQELADLENRRKQLLMAELTKFLEEIRDVPSLVAEMDKRLQEEIEKDKLLQEALKKAVDMNKKKVEEAVDSKMVKEMVNTAHLPERKAVSEQLILLATQTRMQVEQLRQFYALP